MSGFDRGWLDLREPQDAAARAAAALERRLPIGSAAGRTPLQVVDLGCGTGANLRYLAPRLAPAQEWLLVDDDAALLDALEAPPGLPLPCRVRTLRLDLARRLDALELPRGGLVTASALLDLVSEEWLAGLAHRCRRAEAAVLFALTYDGRIGFEPGEPDDAWVAALVNRHQRTDKGFGPALGPSAPARAEALLTAAGYGCATGRSDWRLAPEHGDLQTALLEGWCRAAAEIEPDTNARARIDAWRRRREAHVAAGRSRILVGHVDIAGVPGGALG